MALVAIIRDPTDRQLRQFGGIFLPAFLLLVAFVAHRAGLSRAVPASLLLVAVASLGTTLVRPRLLRRPFVALQVLAFPLGWLLGHALLAVVFFGVVTPIGLVLRLFRKDPLRRRIERDVPSHWESRKPTSSLERYFRPY
jgi:carbamoyltransferase